MLVPNPRASLLRPALLCTHRKAGAEPFANASGCGRSRMLQSANGSGHSHPPWQQKHAQGSFIAPSHQRTAQLQILSESESMVGEPQRRTSEFSARVCVAAEHVGCCARHLLSLNDLSSTVNSRNRFNGLKGYWEASGRIARVGRRTHWIAMTVGGVPSVEMRLNSVSRSSSRKLPRRAISHTSVEQDAPVGILSHTRFELWPRKSMSEVCLDRNAVALTRRDARQTSSVDNDDANLV